MAYTEWRKKVASFTFDCQEEDENMLNKRRTVFWNKLFKNTKPLLLLPVHRTTYS